MNDSDDLSTPAPGTTRRPGRLSRRGGEPTDSGGEGTERVWQFRALIAVGVAALVLAATTVTFASLWQQESGDADRLQAIRRSSGEFADRFLTIRTNEPEEWQERVLERSTGAFRRTFEEGLETQLVQTFFSLEDATTRATIEEIFVGEVDDRAAHVVVQAEIATTLAGEGGAPEGRGSVSVYLELDLVHQDGDWLVDGLNNLNFGATPRARTTTSTTE
ncbi:MAG TPA: hypothetical protein VM618_09260 [Acidimicrobiia bacterium]|nr:hypothetical protein [Acidimicrobiia bacterium]